MGGSSSVHHAVRAGKGNGDCRCNAAKFLAGSGTYWREAQAMANWKELWRQSKIVAQPFMSDLIAQEADALAYAESQCADALDT